MKTTKILALSLCCLTILISQKAFSQQCTHCPSSTTDEWSSNALGHSNTASGAGSAAIGFRNQTLAIGSIAIGKDLHVPNDYGYNIVIGGGYDEGPNYWLSNNVANSLMIGFRSNVHTFLVTPAPSNGKTGKIGIGSVINPQAKLHIRADDNEDATLRLETTASDRFSRIYFSNDHHITATIEHNLSFSIPDSSTFIFENGKVGIGTSQPEAKLHVNGDFQVGDLENPQEIRLHGSINAEGEYATSFGESNIASGSYSFVAGLQSEASKPNSVVIGSWSKATGDNSFVIGNFSHALAVDSYVFGNNSTSEFDFSMALGHNILSRNGAFVLGNGRVDAKLTNNHQESLMIGFNSAFPTLFVSRTQLDYQSGKVGIGNVTAPQAKLHIRADEQEDATLRLEATGSEKHSRIYFTDDHHITAATDDHMHFHTAADKGFVFHEGDIYLSDVQSGIIMKSPNGQCWRGVMTDAGSLSFAQTTCPDEASFVPEPPVQQGKLKAYPNPTNGNLIIETELYGKNTEIAISSMEGKMMLRQMITSERTEVSLKSFTPGTYILQLLTNGQVVESSKVVRQ
jgi:hypothetical protein